MPLGGGDDGADVVDHVVVETRAQPSDVDDHVELHGAIRERLSHLRGLGGAARRAVREPMTVADGDPRARQAPDGVGDIGRTDADAEDAPLRGDVELCVDLRAGELGLEDRVVDRWRRALLR